MRGWVVGIAVVTLAPAIARAQARDTLTDGTAGSDRPAAGQVTARQGFATSSEVGLWARAPLGFDPMRPLLVAGGDIGLSSWLVVHLYGVDDFMQHAFSGMTLGMSAWLLPRTSPIQLVASVGAVESTTPGAPSTYGQIAATAAFGLFQVGGSVRTSIDLVARSGLPTLTTSVWMTYGRAVKVGLAYVDEAATATAPARRAIVPSVTVSTKGGGVDFGASSSIGVGGATTVPVMLRVGGKF
jgi:hypothetical protein